MQFASSWSRSCRRWVAHVNSMQAGIDEAGRGALAGPLLVACVGGLPVDASWVQDLRDSKKLSAAKRECLFEDITRDCQWVETEEIDARQIDRVNIFNATLGGMGALLNRLRATHDVARVVVDGNHLPESASGDARVVAMPKADDIVREVMAASIVAKVTRDRIMAAHPDTRFSFAQHKGYGTGLHRMEIQDHGRTAFHRQSFKFQGEKLPFRITKK